MQLSPTWLSPPVAVAPRTWFSDTRRFIVLVGLMLSVAIGYPTSAEAWWAELTPEAISKWSPERVAAEREFFESHIRPLLVAKCQGCHGPEEQKSDFRVDSLAELLSGGTSGPAIVPFEPGESLLLEAVRYESLEMPPDERLSSAEIELLESWIKRGAYWPGDGGERAHQEKFSADDRAYWAFQPLTSPSPPRVERQAWPQTAVDSFILARLETAGLEPAPEADRATLIRRLYFDLTGLPPTVEQVEKFVEDPSPAAYEQLVDRLLADPAYGEHLGRLWLDLVRYAESDGYKQDTYRPQAWRYRDYVIQSLNRDKPYGRFVMEQLAGDELDPHSPEARIATGYLRLYTYEYNQRDARLQWNEILNQLTDVTADTFLGLGYGCARCHDHKFDPILREDYYRLQAFFAGMIPRDDQPAVEPPLAARHDFELEAWRAATVNHQASIDEIYRPYRERAANAALSKLPADIQAIWAKDDADRSVLEKQLAYLAGLQIQVEVDNIKLNDADQKRVQELQAEQTRARGPRPEVVPTALTVTDLGAVEPEVTIPGDRRQRNIAAGFLSLLDERPAQLIGLPADVPSTGRRLTLAQWIADPQNPLTSRVMVNRLWQHHFGLGIVATPSDFGRLGEQPSHPELLDYLASRLVASGGSWKAVQREIVLSATYRQSSQHPQAEVYLQTDPRNTLRWRWELKRLNAEQIRDTLLALGGGLDRSATGPGVKPEVTRRSVYGQVRRNSPVEFLATFDAPDGINTMPRRNETVTANQALLMLNGPWAMAQARQLAQLIRHEMSAQPSPEAPTAAGPINALRSIPEPAQWQRWQAWIRALYVRVLQREPDGRELQEGVQFFQWAAVDPEGSPSASEQEQAALVDLAHVLLNSSELFYVD